MSKPLPFLKKSQERIGQYSTVRRASRHAKALEVETGRKHCVESGVTYRDLKPVMCFTVVLK